MSLASRVADQLGLNALRMARPYDNAPPSPQMVGIQNTLAMQQMINMGQQRFEQTIEALKSAPPADPMPIRSRSISFSPVSYYQNYTRQITPQGITR